MIIFEVGMISLFGGAFADIIGLKRKGAVLMIAGLCLLIGYWMYTQ